jgi:gp18, tail protein
LIAAAGAFLGDVVGASLKDKLFAWNEFTDAVRREAHGRFAYRDAVGSGDGWTLSAWQQGFQMLAQGAGMVSVGFQSSGASPYEWGRDFRAGDQQGLLHRGVLFATYVHSVTLKYQVGKGWSQELTLGDPRARESFVRGATRSIKGVKNAVDRVKSFIM